MSGSTPLDRRLRRLNEHVRIDVIQVYPISCRWWHDQMSSLLADKPRTRNSRGCGLWFHVLHVIPYVNLCKQGVVRKGGEKGVMGRGGTPEAKDKSSSLYGETGGLDLDSSHVVPVCSTLLGTLHFVGDAPLSWGRRGIRQPIYTVQPRGVSRLRLLDG